MRKINRIAVHTSASYNAKHGGVLDPSAADIDRMHKARGWSGIGYHAVIRRDGTFEYGRALLKVGAGIAGANSDTLHVCCTGHGDYADFTDAQKNTLCDLCYTWLKLFDLLPQFRSNPFRVFGHREVNQLVAAGAYPASAKTSKTCPGKKVDMSEIRRRIWSYIAQQEGWQK